MTPEEQAKADTNAAEAKAREEQAERTKAEFKRRETEEAAAKANVSNGVTQQPGQAPQSQNNDATRAAAQADPAHNPAAKPTPAHVVAEPEVGVNNPNSIEAIKEQHERRDRELAERSAANEEGHQKNMDKIEAQADEAHARTQHAGDPRANHVPTGKENNRNTPTVLPDGTKVWN
jgi:hypothetical protein